MISLNLFGSDKCDDYGSSSRETKYPITSFENTNLPKMRVTSRLFEFSDDKLDYEIVCFSWPPEVNRHGVKQACKGWCLLPRSNESSAISLVDIDSSIKKCSRCDSSKKDGQCAELKILKNPSQSVSIGSGEKTALFQMGVDGSLLVFQTSNNLKDLNKPYLTLTRESEYFEKNKLEIKVQNVADNGYINTARMTLTKSDTNQNISAKSLTQRTEKVPGAQPTDGKRSCSQIKLKISSCPENVENFEVSNYPANRLSCSSKQNRGEPEAMVNIRIGV